MFASLGRLLVRWLPPFVWMGVIYFLSTDHLSFPELRRTWTGFLAAKAAHLTEYSTLCLLWYRAISGNLGRWKAGAAMLSFAAALVYAVLDEMHQSLTVHRNGRAQDVLLDSVGALFAMIALWAALRAGPPAGGGSPGLRSLEAPEALGRRSEP